MEFQPVATIRSPHQGTEGMPIQPAGARGMRGRIEFLPEYEQGLADIEGFSHLILIYAFHQSPGCRLSVTPFLDNATHGVFATRAPSRPNPIGLSVVRLLGRSGPVLEIEDVDILDGTPLLDLKPYVPEFDSPVGALRCGWLEDAARRAANQRSDDRFASDDS